MVDAGPAADLRSGLDDWGFEEGLFCRNKLCNLRVETLVRTLQVQAAAWERLMPMRPHRFQGEVWSSWTS